MNTLYEPRPVDNAPGGHYDEGLRRVALKVSASIERILADADRSMLLRRRGPHRSGSRRVSRGPRKKTF
jgi:hypothetical protein